MVLKNCNSLLGHLFFVVVLLVNYNKANGQEVSFLDSNYCIGDTALAISNFDGLLKVDEKFDFSSAGIDTSFNQTIPFVWQSIDVLSTSLHDNTILFRGDNTDFFQWNLNPVTNEISKDTFPFNTIPSNHQTFAIKPIQKDSVVFFSGGYSTNVVSRHVLNDSLFEGEITGGGLQLQTGQISELEIFHTGGKSGYLLVGGRYGNVKIYKFDNLLSGPPVDSSFIPLTGGAFFLSLNCITDSKGNYYLFVNDYNGNLFNLYSFGQNLLSNTYTTINLNLPKPIFALEAFNDGPSIKLLYRSTINLLHAVDFSTIGSVPEFETYPISSPSIGSISRESNLIHVNNDLWFIERKRDFNIHFSKLSNFSIPSSNNTLTKNDTLSTIIGLDDSLSIFTFFGDSVSENRLALPKQNIAIASLSIDRKCLSDSSTFIVAFDTLGRLPVDSFYWEFSDGITIYNRASVKRLFQSAGVYRYKLVYFSSDCRVVIRDSLAIFENDIRPHIIIPDSICANNFISITDSSSFIQDSIIQILWEISGDNYTVLDTGSNTNFLLQDDDTVFITVTYLGVSNCETVLDTFLITQPSPNFDLLFSNTCLSDSTILFADTNKRNLTQAIRFEWEINDSIYSTISNSFSLVLPDTGIYPLFCRAFGPNGCFTTRADTIQVINPAKFVLESTSACANTLSSLFIRNSIFEAPLKSIRWNINNGWLIDTSGALGISFIYPNPDTLSVEIEVTSTTGCKSSLDTTLVILPAIDAGFTVTPRCAGTPTSFTNTSLGGANLSYTWDFSGLGISSLANPSFSFPDSGTYEVTLTLRNANGCVDTAIRSVVIPTLPAVEVLKPDLCIGDSALLIASGVGETSTIQWLIEGQLYENDSVLIEQVNNTLLPFTYSIASEDGCTLTVTDTLRVNTIPDVEIQASFSFENTPSTPVNLRLAEVFEVDSLQWFKNGMPLSVDTSSFFDTLSAGQYEYSLVAYKNNCTSAAYTNVLIPELTTNDLKLQNVEASPVANGYQLYATLKNDSPLRVDSVAIFIEFFDFSIAQDLNVTLEPNLEQEVSLGQFSDSAACVEVLPLSYLDADTTNNTFCLEQQDFETQIGDFYPNPSSGIFSAQLQYKSSQPISFRVYHLSGKLASEGIWQLSGSGEEVVDIDLRGLPEGIYLAEISLDDRVLLRKMSLIQD